MPTLWTWKLLVLDFVLVNEIRHVIFLLEKTVPRNLFTSLRNTYFPKRADCRCYDRIGFSAGQRLSSTTQEALEKYIFCKYRQVPLQPSNIHWEHAAGKGGRHFRGKKLKNTFISRMRTLWKCDLLVPKKLYSWKFSLLSFETRKPNAKSFLYLWERAILPQNVYFWHVDQIGAFGL